MDKGLYFPYRDNYLKVLRTIEDLVLSDRIPYIKTELKTKGEIYGYLYSWDCDDYQIKFKTEGLHKRLIIKRRIVALYEVSYEAFCSDEACWFDTWRIEVDGKLKPYEKFTKLNPYKWYFFFNDLYKILKAKKIING